jgi:biopolymer transport protein ExbB/TolQ
MLKITHATEEQLMNNPLIAAATETVTTVTSTALTEPMVNESLWESIARFMQEGGTFMYIILGIFLIGLAIAIERFLFLSTVKLNNRKMWKELQPFLDKGDIKNIEALTQNSKTGIARMLSYGIAQSQHGRRSDDIELAMEEGLMEILPRLEKRTQYLATFANIATLLGLLGTIMGLISAFTAVANVDPAEKANLLSASISVAMNTTAFGLMAAIPLLLSFSYLQSKTTEIVDSLEMASVKFVNKLRKGQAHA